MTEERCRGCEVFGGAGEACVPEHEWGPEGIYQRDYDRPCPRVALEAENAQSWKLVWLGMHEPTRPLMAALAQNILDEEPGVTGRGIISRAAGCLLSPRAVSFMYPPVGGTSAGGKGQHAKNVRKAHSSKPMQPVDPRAVRSTATAPPPPPGGRR